MGMETMQTGVPKAPKKPTEIVEEKLAGLSEQEKSLVMGIRTHDALLELVETKIKDVNPELYSDIRGELGRLFESLHNVYNNPPGSNRKKSVDLEYIGHDLNTEIGSIGEAARKVAEKK